MPFVQHARLSTSVTNGIIKLERVRQEQFLPPPS